MRAGVLTREEAELSPFRNVITRSIGATPNVLPDFYEESVQEGDIWLLCSDGLTGHVEDSEIAAIIGSHAPSEATRQLVELANARGGRDNITVFVLSVRAVVPCEGESAEGKGVGLEGKGVGLEEIQRFYTSPPQTSPESALGDENLGGTQKPTAPFWRRFLLGS